MAKRFTDTDKWKKGFMRSLPAKYKLLWLYMLDDCNHAGVWETDFEVASIRIGSKISEKDAAKVFARNKWFIPKFIDFQYGTLNENSRPHQAVIKLLDKYDVYNIEGISPVDVAGIDGEISKKPVLKRFKKPSKEEIKDYCAVRSNNVSAEKFFDYYETLFFSIPATGQVNSHEYLVKRSSEYLGGGVITDTEQAYIDEINGLRQQLLEANANYLNLNQII